MRIIVFVCQAALLAGVAACADTGEFFESKVRPVLAANCYSCHTDSRMGGLRLDSSDALQKGGKSGPPRFVNPNGTRNGSRARFSFSFRSGGAGCASLNASSTHSRAGVSLSA